MNKKLILGLVIGVVVICGGIYLLSPHNPSILKNPYSAQPDSLPRVLDRVVEGQITSVGNGWSQYSSNEWGLTFQFPQNWKIQEQVYNPDPKLEIKYREGEGLATIEVAGDGYGLLFTTRGLEYPSSVDTRNPVYVVSGQKTRAFEDDMGEGFMLDIYDACKVGIRIESLVHSKDLIDKIISSIQCSEE